MPQDPFARFVVLALAGFSLYFVLSILVFIFKPRKTPEEKRRVRGLLVGIGIWIALGCAVFGVLQLLLALGRS